MKRLVLPLSILLLAHASCSMAADKAPDWSEMIECRSHFSDYTAFVMGDFQDQGYRNRVGVKEVAQDNPFLAEYELPQPVRAYGYDTKRIAFSSSGVMAVLENVDAAALAGKLGLDMVMRTPAKLMATRLVRSTPPEVVGASKMWQEVSRELSTVTTHPGQVLVGCSYSLHVEDN